MSNRCPPLFACVVADVETLSANGEQYLTQSRGGGETQSTGQLSKRKLNIRCNRIPLIVSLLSSDPMRLCVKNSLPISDGRKASFPRTGTLRILGESGYWLKWT